MAKAKEPVAAETMALAVNAPRGAMVVLPQVKDYAIVRFAEGGGGDLQEALKENMGGATLNTFDFQRIKVPSGEAIAWNVIDTETGELDTAKSFEGIIVGFKDQKAYWKTSLNAPDAKKGPPDCSSTDCIKGVGDPGIFCAKCPNNVFGTANAGTGRGKACKDWRALFVIRAGDFLPIVLPVPPTSLKPVKDYLLQRLGGKGIVYYNAVTRFNLSPEKNNDGKPFAKVDPELVGTVPPEAQNVIKAYHQMIKSMMNQGQGLPAHADDLAPEVIDPSAPVTPPLEHANVSDDRAAQV